MRILAPLCIQSARVRITHASSFRVISRPLLASKPIQALSKNSEDVNKIALESEKDATRNLNSFLELEPVDDSDNEGETKLVSEIMTAKDIRCASVTDQVLEVAVRSLVANGTSLL